MKIQKVIYGILLAASSVVAVSCSDDNKLDDESCIIVTTKEQNDFDRWLQANYVEPYNITFKYRYEEIESDFDYYTVPADMEQAIQMAHVVKYICMEAYDEVAGPDFTRAYFPKEFYLIGEWEYRNNGEFILGTAEGGKKILLSGINYFNQYKTSMANLTHYYLKTIHHEFTHILNQTKEMPVDFQYITGTDYVGGSWSEPPYNGIDENAGRVNNWYYGHGFISDYAQQEYAEDFAEMVSIYVCYPESHWQEILANARNGYTATDGTKVEVDCSALLEAKLSIVKNYMRDSWNIDLDELRDVIQRRSAEIEAGKVDLMDLTVQ